MQAAQGSPPQSPASRLGADRARPTPGEPAVRQGPQPVRPGDHGIGRRVGDVSVTDLAGVSQALGKLSAGRITVFALTSTSCPLSRKYLPTLKALVAASGDGVAWILVDPVATDTPADMQAAAANFGGRAIYVHDPTGRVATAIGALTTTDVVVLTPDRTVAYHGAIDDQYGFGYSLDAPRKRFLVEAIAAIRVGEEPLVSATEAPGCVLDVPPLASPAADVTYHGRISRIMERHCVECHRDGGVGPFALDSYDDLAAHAGMVRQVIDRGTMPPWFAAPVAADAETGRVHTPWANDRSLAEPDKKALLAWLAGARPEGDPADAPAPRRFHDGWQIGTPDAVFEFAAPVPVKATGVMPYQTVIVETHLPKDRWVQAIEVQPGDRNVVHHALIHLAGAEEQAGDSRDAAAEERGGFWGKNCRGRTRLSIPPASPRSSPRPPDSSFSWAGTAVRNCVGRIFRRDPTISGTWSFMACNSTGWFRIHVSQRRVNSMCCKAMLVVLIAAELLLGHNAGAADWPEFRGGMAGSLAPQATAPTQWSNTDHLAWRTAIPGAGWSQPIVAGERIYLTTAVGPRADNPSGMGGVMSLSTWGMASAPKEPVQWRVLCLDPSDGKILWSKTVVEAVPKFAKHASNTYATETPCASDDTVFAFFGSTGTLAALDRQGNERWRRNFGPQPMQNQFGTGSSPVLYRDPLNANAGDRLLLQLYNEETARLHCLNPRTGDDIWTADRDKGTAWSTPVVWLNDGTAEVVTAGQGSVIAYGIADGRERWRLGGLDTSFACSVVADAEGVYFGTSSPGSKAPVYAIGHGHLGDLTLSKGQTATAAVLWSKTKSGAGMPSPVVVGDLLYFFGDKAVCYDKRTGVEKYRKRLPGGTTAVGCPLVIGNRIYLVNERGRTIVLEAGPEFKILAESAVGSEDEIFWATPAVSGDSLLIRSSEAVYCIR